MIHPNVLKECAAELSYPLHTLFRKSLDEGSLPHQWKDGHITTVFKKGLRNQIDNFRPRSLISVACKLMERLIRNALMQHMIENNLLSYAQHGLTPGAHV